MRGQPAQPIGGHLGVGCEKELLLVAVGPHDHGYLVELTRFQGLERVSCRQDRPVAQGSGHVDHAQHLAIGIGLEDLCGGLAAQVGHRIRGGHLIKALLCGGAVAGGAILLEKRVESLGRGTRMSGRSVVGGILGFFGGRCTQAAALDDRAVKESGGLRGQQQAVDVASSGRLAEDRHVVRVAAEGTDVFLHPAQRFDHVENGEIAGTCHRVGVLAQGCVAKEPERSHAVLDGDDDNSPVADQFGPLIEIGISDRIATAMNPDHDRKSLAGRQVVGCVHIQSQAIFLTAELFVRAGLPAEATRELGAGDTGLEGLEVRGHRCCRHWRFPASIATGRFGVGDAAPHMVAGNITGAQKGAGRGLASGGRVDDVRFLGRCAGRPKQTQTQPTDGCYPSNSGFPHEFHPRG